MNKWQKVFLDRYGQEFEGCPEYYLLGQIGESVKVFFPDNVEKYTVTEGECNMPEGLISVEVLASNLEFWLEQGFLVQSEGKNVFAEKRHVPDGYHECKYCGNLVRGTNEDLLCDDCIMTFGHRLFSEL